MSFSAACPDAGQERRPASESEDIGPHLVAEPRQPSLEPAHVLVVVRCDMADEDEVTFCHTTIKPALPEFGRVDIRVCVGTHRVYKSRCRQPSANVGKEVGPVAGKCGTEGGTRPNALRNRVQNAHFPW